MRPAGRRVVRARKPRPALPPHAFDPDARLAATFDGRRVCRACRKVGRAGDAQHPDGSLPLGRHPMPEVPQAALDLDARILGEAGE